MILPATMTVCGHIIAFDRRNMGGVLYVWAFALVGAKWVQLGDPWLREPGRKELAARINLLYC